MIDNNDKYATIVTVECRGLELVGFEPREGWKAKGHESGTPFEDIDLTEGDWADYDEKVNARSTSQEGRKEQPPFRNMD